ncbi:MAG: hypothetical protein ABR505_01915 [Actinomycetota bacterium]
MAFESAWAAVAWTAQGLIVVEIAGFIWLGMKINTINARMDAWFEQFDARLARLDAEADADLI